MAGLMSCVGPENFFSLSRLHHAIRDRLGGLRTWEMILKEPSGLAEPIIKSVAGTVAASRSGYTLPLRDSAVRVLATGGPPGGLGRQKPGADMRALKIG
jgi:hypothetical protein